MTKPNLDDVLGDEAASITGAIQAVVAIFVAFGVITGDASGVIMTVVLAATGLIASWATENTRLTFIVEMVKTVLAAAVFFGATDLSITEQGALVAAVAAVGSAFLRGSTSTIPTVLSKPSLGYAPQFQPGDAIFSAMRPDELDDDEDPLEPDEPGEHRREV